MLLFASFRFLSGGFGFANLLLIFTGNLRQDHRSHTFGQQANHLFSHQQFWSTSAFWSAFWWSALLLQPACEVAGLPALSSICVNILSNPTFTSNCFRLPLYLWPPRYQAHLVVKATSLARPPPCQGHLVVKATSLSGPPRYQGHFLITPPRYQTHLVVKATSLSRPSHCQGHLVITATSLSRPSRCQGHLVVKATSLSRPPRCQGHLVVKAISLSRPPRYHGHLVINAIFLSRPPRY